MRKHLRYNWRIISPFIHPPNTLLITFYMGETPYSQSSIVRSCSRLSMSTAIKLYMKAPEAHAAAAAAAPWGWNGAAIGCRRAPYPHLHVVGAGNRADPCPAWHGERANGGGRQGGGRPRAGRSPRHCCCRPRPRATVAAPLILFYLFNFCQRLPDRHMDRGRWRAGGADRRLPARRIL